MSCPENEPSDPRVRRTRSLLQDALRSLMHEQKFNTISVQDIAERATVNRATFYAHYDDKYALLSSILKAELGGKLWKRFPERTPLSRENLVLLTLAVFEFIGDTRQQCPDSARDMEHTIGTILQEEIHTFLDNWLRYGGVPRTLQGHARETICTTFSWSIFGGAHNWARGTRAQTPLEAAREIATLLMPEDDAPARSAPETKQRLVRA